MAIVMEINNIVIVCLSTQQKFPLVHWWIVAAHCWYVGHTRMSVDTIRYDQVGCEHLVVADTIRVSLKLLAAPLQVPPSVMAAVLCKRFSACLFIADDMNVRVRPKPGGGTDSEDESIDIDENEIDIEPPTDPGTKIPNKIDPIPGWCMFCKTSKHSADWFGICSGWVCKLQYLAELKVCYIA